MKIKVFGGFWGAAFVVAVSLVGTANAATLYNENFSSNGGPWYLTGSGVGTADVAQVYNGRFRVRDTNGSGGSTVSRPVRWNSDPINISGYTNIKISMDLWGGGKLDSNDEARLGYKLNGGLDVDLVWILGEEGEAGRNGFRDYGVPNGSTIQLYARLDTKGDPEWWEIDNVRVTGDFIPEPASFALLGIGSVLIARRRHRSSSGFV